MSNKRICGDRVQVAQSNTDLKLQTPAIEMEWDLARGGILTLCRDPRSGVTFLDARTGNPAPDIIVSVSEALEAPSRDLRMSEMGVAAAELFIAPDGASARIELATVGTEVAIFRTITVRSDSPWVEERIAVQNVSDRDLLIDRYPEWKHIGGAVAGDLFNYRIRPGGVEYALHGLRLGDEWQGDEYVLPACAYPFFYNRGKFAEMGPVAINLVAGHHGAVLPCVMAYNEAKQAGLLLSCLGERSMRYLNVSADQAFQTGNLIASVWWARWLAPRERQEVASVYLMPFEGNYGRALDTFRHWLASEHGIHGPTQQAPQIDEMFAAAFPAPLAGALGDFSRLLPYVDRARSVGCTAIFECGNWNDAADQVAGALLSRCQPITREGRYDTTDRFGGETAHRILRDHIHACGMKYMVWFTGYGLTTFGSEFKEQREMFITMRRPTEVPLREHSQWPGYDFALGWDDDWAFHPFGGPTVGADTTHARWRAFWLHNQEYWAAHGVDGCLFDSFNPMPPNYALRPWPGQISLEIINLQREARQRARQINPDYFTCTEGGGYLMATVNDFTHTWHGCTPPPLPPFRTRALSPEEESTFLRDEGLSMILGARSWRTLADGSHECHQWDPEATRPRRLYSMFTPTLPILPMFIRGKDGDELWESQTAYWHGFQPRPANAQDPRDEALYADIGRLWQIRQAHPELKSGQLDLWAVSADDPAVNVLLRQKDDNRTILALNFRPTEVTCTVRIDVQAAGIVLSDAFAVQELLTDITLSRCTGADLANGYTVTIPSRGGVLLKLCRQ